MSFCFTNATIRYYSHCTAEYKWISCFSRLQVRQVRLTRLQYKIFVFLNQKDKYDYLLNKQCITLKSDLIYLIPFLNQPYILTVWNDNATKVILFLKNIGFYVQRHRARYAEIFDQKINSNYITRFKILAIPIPDIDTHTHSL